MQQYRDIFDEPISVYTVNAWRGNDGVLKMRFEECNVQAIGQFIDAGAQKVQHINKTRRTLAEALQAWGNGDRGKYDALMDAYKLMKWGAPVAMMQGVNPSHDNNDTHFESYTDVICLDIDAPKPDKEPNGNEWIKPEDWPLLKAELGKIPFVAYCGLSVGGRGLFLLIPIKSHTNHLGHWRALQRLFKAQNITIDEDTKNIGRLRFMSYDPSPIINHHAQVFEAIASETPTMKEYKPITFAPMANDDEERILHCVREIEAKGIDITASHDEWKKASAAIAHHMGERGRGLFHSIARQYPKYNQKENDKLYTNMMKSYAGQTANIASFFYLCKQYGIDIGHERKPLPTPNIKTPKKTPSTSGMSKAETAELERMRPQIEQEQQRLTMMEEQKPIIGDLCNTLDLEVSGNDIWEMTNEQFTAVYGDSCPF